MVKAHTKARAIVSRPDVLSGEPTVAGARYLCTNGGIGEVRIR